MLDMSTAAPRGQLEIFITQTSYEYEIVYRENLKKTAFILAHAFKDFRPKRTSPTATECVRDRIFNVRIVAEQR